MCKFIEVSRSGYYEWLSRPLKEKQDDSLIEIITTIFNEGRKTYGTRRIKKKLAMQNKIVSRRRIGRLMKESGLACKTKHRFKLTTESKHTNFISPNLLGRQFKVMEKNRYWVGDITYISTQEGWLYLAIVLDLYSRQVVGWSMDSRMKAELVNKALLMAIWKRKPPKGLIWHTDRGSQYASDSHRFILQDHHIIQSMSRKGDCWDNAVAESFFHSLKTELIHHCKFKNIEEARQMIFEYLEVFYNRIRIHSANNYLSPIDYEQIQKSA
jgi:transposase InsO family protein